MKKWALFIISAIAVLLLSITVFAATNTNNAAIPATYVAGLQRIIVLYLLGIFIAASIVLTAYSEYDEKNKKVSINNNNKNRNNNSSSNNINSSISSNSNSKNIYFYSLSGLALLLRLFIAPVLEGHSIDMSCFKAWASWAANDLFGFYRTDNFVDYPPLYIYVLALTERIRLLFGPNQPAWFYITMIKLPSLLADVACGYILYVYGMKKTTPHKAILLATLYLFNPVTILNSAVWGQVDGFFTMLLMIGVIFMLEEKYVEASIFYALTILMKPQGLIFLPVLFFVLAKKRNSILFLKCIGAAALSFFIPVLLLSYKQEPLWIFKLYFNTAASYKGASINAYNLFAMIGANWKDDSDLLLFLSYKTWGFIFIVLVTLFVAILIFKSNKNFSPIIASIAIITGVFLLSSKMHERYLFPVMALLTIACILNNNKVLRYLLAGFTLTNFINIFQVFLLSLKAIYWVPANDGLMIFTSMMNFVLFIITFYVSYKLCIESNKVAIMPVKKRR